MKKAFTMLELVVVIVVIGIIAVAALPRINDDHIAEAADQVMSHIRYTQHLAMQDSKFDPDDNDWFRKRWSIFFSSADFCDTDGDWKYTVYFDDTLSGNPNSAREIARDPLDPNKFMSAGWSGIGTNCFGTSSKYNLTRNFGVTSVSLSDGCRTDPAMTVLQTISFDEFGRPIANATGATFPYDRLIRNGQVCTITLQTAQKQAVITISPETGYLQVAYSDR